MPDVITPQLERAGVERHRPKVPCATFDLSALKVGNEVAWTQAFRLLWPVALRAAGHPAARLTSGEVEEVANEALAQLVSRIGEVGTSEELKALTAAIAFRGAISQARRNGAIKRGPVPRSFGEFPSEDDAFRALCPVAGDRLSDVDLRDMILLLHQALAGLDAETRGLLEEKMAQGLSYQELSAKHAMSVGTVCAKVWRGLAKARRQLSDSPTLMKELSLFLR